MKQLELISIKKSLGQLSQPIKRERERERDNFHSYSHAKLETEKRQKTLPRQRFKLDLQFFNGEDDNNNKPFIFSHENIPPRPNLNDALNSLDRDITNEMLR